jgi:hypothetical protein
MVRLKGYVDFTTILESQLKTDLKTEAARQSKDLYLFTNEVIKKGLEQLSKPSKVKSR